MKILKLKQVQIIVAFLLLFQIAVFGNGKSCKAKLCICAAEAKKSQSNSEKEYFSNVIEGTLVIIDDIPKDLEPTFGQILDKIVLVSGATPKTENYIRPPVSLAIYDLGQFTLFIAELQTLDSNSKEYKDKVKKIKDKFK